jgi:hypothetical protein
VISHFHTQKPEQLPKQLKSKGCSISQPTIAGTFADQTSLVVGKNISHFQPVASGAA